MDAQSQFVSDASHELRTPLTALQTTNEVALRKKSLSTNDAKTLLRHNVEEIDKLHKLTSSLLSLVNTNHVDPICDRVSLQDVVSEAMNSVIPLAQSKNITVDDTVPLIHVIANKSSIVQVLRILIENAIKYSPKKSSIQLSAETIGSDLVLRVIDKGIGIPKSEQGKIFTRFYRVDQSRSKNTHDGYGLGLAIAKNICDHQGMKLTVESIEGKGSTFSIQIKLSEKD
jgi:signal transduction histidine kinase